VAGTSTALSSAPYGSIVTASFPRIARHVATSTALSSSADGTRVTASLPSHGASSLVDDLKATVPSSSTCTEQHSTTAASALSGLLSSLVYVARNSITVPYAPSPQF
jgi:hypothetical protein